MIARRTVFVLMLGVALAAGCGKASGKLKGVAPKGAPLSVLAVHAGDTPTAVTLRGTLVEKCPVAGCWFRLLDDTGVIKVDTKSAGFVVTEIPLTTVVTVGGRVSHEGDETIIEATGLQY